jgi:hypothetical protein
MADKRRYHFTEKVRSRGGVLAARLAGASLLLLVVDVIISFVKGGKGGYIIGVLGLTAMLLSVFGFYAGMKSFEENRNSPTWSVIGSIMSGVVMVIWLTLLLTGIR